MLTLQHTMKTRSDRGRKELPHTEKKKRLDIYLHNKYIDTLGADECRRVALQAIDKAYKDGTSHS